MEVRETHISKLGLQGPIVPQCIVDIEISNNIARLGWEYNRGEACIIGILLGEKITQFLLCNKEKRAQFAKMVNDFLSETAQKPHAFNINMENGCFRNLLGRDIKFSEIKPFSGKGANKEYFFSFLLKNGIVNISGKKLIDPLNGNGRLVESAWKEGRYEDVRRHNVCCLIKEAFILRHRKEIMEKHSNLIDERGWLRDGASLSKY